MGEREPNYILQWKHHDWLPLGAPWVANHPSSSSKNSPPVASYSSSKALSLRKHGTGYTNGEELSLVYYWICINARMHERNNLNIKTSYRRPYKHKR